MHRCRRCLSVYRTAATWAAGTNTVRSRLSRHNWTYPDPTARTGMQLAHATIQLPGRMIDTVRTGGRLLWGSGRHPSFVSRRRHTPLDRDQTKRRTGRLKPLLGAGPTVSAGPTAGPSSTPTRRRAGGGRPRSSRRWFASGSGTCSAGRTAPQTNGKLERFHGEIVRKVIQGISTG